MTYIEERRNMKLFGKPAKEEKKYVIAKKSEKRLKQEAEQKESGKDVALDKFYEVARKKLTGVCQCGCGKKSSKDDDKFYRSSICHVFPKSKFKSVATHPMNFVERAIWGGCHSIMDDGSMDKWPTFADWPDIKEKFFALAPLLTEKERANKFYTHFEKLVYGLK